MYKDTTSAFYPQGHLTSGWQVAIEGKEATCRAEQALTVERALNWRLEEEVDAELGERGRPLGGVSSRWKCDTCDSSLRKNFRRNGHYRRRLLTLEGMVTLRVPLIRCKCGTYVKVSWKMLPSRQRKWCDVTIGGLEHYLSGASYRKTAALMSHEVGAHVSHMAGWVDMQRAGRAAREVKKQLTCPEVVILDEMYVSVAGAKKTFLLVTDTDGHILLYGGPCKRSPEDWQQVLDRLTRLGVSPEHGLKAVVADGDRSIRIAVAMVWGQIKVQTCVWHVLNAVYAEARRVFGETSALVKAVVNDARAVLMHETRTEESLRKAAARLAEFVKKYVGQPWVDTVARSFAEATAYLRSPELPRTNGTAERAIKEIRRRVKTMDGFKSQQGAMNFMAIFVQWYNWLRDCAQTIAQLSRPRNLKTASSSS
jgi:transposase-like protein